MDEVPAGPELVNSVLVLFETTDHGQGNLRSTILEEMDVDMLVGMDILRRYDCDICLRDNVLRFHPSDKQPVSVPFLGPDGTPLGAAVTTNRRGTPSQSDSSRDASRPTDDGPPLGAAGTTNRRVPSSQSDSPRDSSRRVRPRGTTAPDGGDPKDDSVSLAGM